MDKLLEEFVKDQEANSIGKLRIKKYESELNTINTKYLMKSYSKLKTEDLKDIVRKIEESSYSEWTKHDFKVMVRKFAKWLNQEHKKKIDTSFISIKVRNNHKLPEELLTQDEVKLLVDNCSTIRDKALISVLYESGTRIGELLSLKTKNVEFDKYGAVLIIPNGKTGSRRVRIINSAILLKNYITNHPIRDPESFLWVTNFNRKNGDGKWTLINSQTVRKLLKTLGKKSGIQKKLYPHLFRHSRATHLANILTESQLKEYLGWTQGSNMAAIYVHLSGKNVDDAILKAHGLIKEDAKPEDVLLKFDDMSVKYPSVEETIKDSDREELILDFLKAIAEEFPTIKERFRSVVKGRENLFN